MMRFIEKRFENLSVNLQRMPMLCITAAFVAGILFFNRCHAVLWAVTGLFTVSLAAAWMLRGRTAGVLLLLSSMFWLGGAVRALHTAEDSLDAYFARDEVPMHEIAVERFSRLRLSPAAAAVSAAMGAGDRSRMTPALSEAYARSGVSHILAVSGLHIGIVYVVVHTLFRIFRLLPHGQIWGGLAVLIPVWLYAAMTGYAPSVVRAAVMLSMLQVARIFSSFYVSVNILAATAFFMLAFAPDDIFDLGFQLSFAAVAAIVTAGIPLIRLADRSSRAQRFVWDTFIIGTVTFAATAPIISHVFGSLSAGGMLINPVVLLCAGITVTVSVLWIAAPLPFIQPAVEWILDTVSGFQNSVVAALASSEHLYAEGCMPLWAVLGVYGVFGLCMLFVWSCDDADAIYRRRTFADDIWTL